MKKLIGLLIGFGVLIINIDTQGGAIENRTRLHVDILVYNNITKEPQSFSLAPKQRIEDIENFDQINKITISANGVKTTTVSTCYNNEMANQMKLSSNRTYNLLVILKPNSNFEIKCTNDKLGGGMAISSEE